ncbi:MAG: hypothetical protein JJLCMIEE_00261 [Acidimicrobiales bacterium]|nr:MAG: arylsulfatase [Actinomycetota bacterium]MBV6507220.1 hypothetical protein [Acidimicrobiales bacterium]RIK05495.1 MAG: arylsulfatase [Acidobacteriota bacterium]
METREFRGVIGRYWWESEQWWPEPPRPPEGAPNVILVVLDDVGFAQLGCYGSDIDTPVIDGLAAAGLRYTNFHTTALCSPTRATLLTGRNHHSNGMGRIIELATGFPGYDTRIPRSNGFVPEVLVPHGYAAWAVGKWHLTPEEECHLGAPRRRWPLGRGFERFYGFFSGETHQFAPALISDNHQVQPPRSYEQGYHLTEDLVDRSVEFIRDLRAVDVDKPFFLYFCPGACHSPHQAPTEWLERYRGRFDKGWDAWRDEALARQTAGGLLPPDTELSPRPDWVPAWDSLPADTRQVFARYMEAFAAFLSHTDHHLGRLLASLHETGDADNTLTFVLSDNGASSEGGPVGSLNDVRAWNALPRTVEEAMGKINEIGGPRHHNNYPWGWTVAGNTPFRRWKREVHEGGVADPLVVHWPSRIADRGGLRRQYVHSIDLAPTILESIGLDAPVEIDGVEQSPIEGTSFRYTFDDAGAADRHRTQYYEMFGCRALYADGWKAVTYHAIQEDTPGLDAAPWELYHVAEDVSECHDLAAENPEKLQELVERWWIEAARHNVLPLDNRPFSEFVFGRPDWRSSRRRYVYWPHQPAVPEAVAANVKGRPHRVTAEVQIGGETPEGVLASQGNVLGGWSFYVKDGCLNYAHNLSGYELHHVRSAVVVPPGAHHLSFSYEKTGDHGGMGRLAVDDQVVGEGAIPRFTWHRFSLTGAGLSCGYSNGLPVTDDYRAPFRFNSRIERLVIEVEGEPIIDADAEAEIAIVTQ